MASYLLFYCIVLISHLTLSSQSPQGSFFGWGSSSDDNAVPKMASESPLNVTPPPPKPVIEQTATNIHMLPPQQQPATIQQQPATIQQQPATIQQNLVSPQPTQNLTSTFPSAVNVNSSSTANVTSLPPPKQNSTLTNYFGPEINAYITTSLAFLGAALGREGCDLKAACLMGVFIPSIQGRDIAMVAAEQLVPEEGRWKVIYQAAKSSMIQGQDCSQFTCV